MSQRIYLLAEGVHDVSFLGKILKESRGLRKIEDAKVLDPEWDLLVPKKFPHQDSLRASIPVPTFYKNAQASVAIVNAEGIDKLKLKLSAHHDQLAKEGIQLDAVGIVLDADYEKVEQKSPLERFQEMAEHLEKLGYPRPATMDTVEKTSPRTGIYVLPGGGELGTLEDLLLECADTTYAPLAMRARDFIERIDTQNASRFTEEEKQAFNDAILPKEQKEFQKPSGRKKAILAAMTAFLKPGKAIQASIEDHRWVGKETLALPRMITIQQFLLDLIGDQPT